MMDTIKEGSSEEKDATATDAASEDAVDEGVNNKLIKTKKSSSSGDIPATAAASSAQQQQQPDDTVPPSDSAESAEDSVVSTSIHIPTTATEDGTLMNMTNNNNNNDNNATPHKKKPWTDTNSDQHCLKRKGNVFARFGYSVSLATGFYAIEPLDKRLSIVLGYILLATFCCLVYVFSKGVRDGWQHAQNVQISSMTTAPPSSGMMPLATMASSPPHMVTVPAPDAAATRDNTSSDSSTMMGKSHADNRDSDTILPVGAQDVGAENEL